MGTTGLLSATSGDNLFVFGGSTASPSFIWGWKNGNGFDNYATSNKTTAFPAGLILGTNAVAVGAGTNTDNNRYMGKTTGTPAELATAIANASNWETSETPLSGDNDITITNGTIGAGFSIGKSTPTNTPTSTFTSTPANTPTPTLPPTSHVPSALIIMSSNVVSAAENQTTMIDVQATDDSDSEGAGLIFSMTGGADHALFNIDANSGALSSERQSIISNGPMLIWLLLT